jgi:hypothetical protein
MDSVTNSYHQPALKIVLKSFPDGLLPQFMPKGAVTLKKGDSMDIKNWRPANLLKRIETNNPMFCKHNNCNIFK